MSICTKTLRWNHPLSQFRGRISLLPYSLWQTSSLFQKDLTPADYQLPLYSLTLTRHWTLLPPLVTAAISLSWTLLTGTSGCVPILRVLLYQADIQAPTDSPNVSTHPHTDSSSITPHTHSSYSHRQIPPRLNQSYSICKTHLIPVSLAHSLH